MSISKTETPSAQESTATSERKRFEALTAHLEEVAKRDPKGYNRRVAALATLGYAYIFAVLLLCLILLGALATILILAHSVNIGLLKLGFFVAVLAFVTVKSLFVRIPPPEGRELFPQEAPQLFAHVEEIGAQLNAPRPHHILLTDEFNAAVAQVPRFGLFGGHRNYLVVGLQLMASLSPQEFKSVLAHEFGHLSANHSRFSGKIYRVRQTCVNLMQEFRGGHDWIFSVFFNWYAPYFAAYSFVLARQNEYVADRCAAEVCGARTTADALTRSEVLGGFLSEKVWPSIFARVGREAEPPRDVYSTLRKAVSTPLESAVANRWLTAAVCRPTDTVDTHPSLTQRLAALQQEPRLTPRDSQSAAEFYLGSQLDALTRQLEQGWSEGVAPVWKKRHAELAQAREKMETIRSKEGPLSDEEQWLLADATEDFGDEETAFALFQEYLVSHPSEGRAHFTVGRLLLNHDDEAGLQHLEHAIEIEHEATLAASQLAEGFLLQHNRSEEAARWRELGLSYSDRVAMAQAERRGVSPKDTLLPHDLPDNEIKALSQHLTRLGTVRKIYVAKKQLAHFPNRPFYIVGVLMEKKKFTLSNDEKQRSDSFTATLHNLTFDYDAMFLQLDAESSRQLHKPLENVAGTLIYSKES